MSNDKPSKDFIKGYEKGFEGKPETIAKIFHKAIGTTKSDSEKSEDFQKGKVQGTADRKSNK